MKRAVLALADGWFAEGKSFGAQGERVGEVIFNTSMTGYQEILTDPSYKGQLVLMTYPLIGNYGINWEDLESTQPQVDGFIVKEYSPYPSNWRSRQTLHEYLAQYSIVGIQGIDTRALTRHIRETGAQQGIISTEDLEPRSLVAKAQAAPGLIGRDLVKEVTCSDPYDWVEGTWDISSGYSRAGAFSPYFVVAYDYGIKRNILRQLISCHCCIKIVPAYTSAEEVLALNPDGIFLSNGPGDPEGVGYTIGNIKKLLDKKPIFGICLGHQILGLAMGGKTYKLKFGHHGANHPVKEISNGKVEITAQNHGFAVDIDSLGGQVKLTHINLYDNTVEGMEHMELPVFSVQYHPEASPGPHDASYLFRRFINLIERSHR